MDFVFISLLYRQIVNFTKHYNRSIIILPYHTVTVNTLEYSSFHLPLEIFLHVISSVRETSLLVYISYNEFNTITART